MSLLHPPNVYGYGTASQHGKVAHFITSATNAKSYAGATTAAEACDLATFLAEGGTGGTVNYLMDDGLYVLGSTITFPNGTATDKGVIAGTTDLVGSSEVNAGMPIIDFEGSSSKMNVGSNNWIENIRVENSTGAGNEGFEFNNANSSITYKCEANACVTGFGGGADARALFCRAVSCTTGFISTEAFFGYCYAELGTTGFNLGLAAHAVFCIATNQSGDNFRTHNNGPLLLHCTGDDAGADSFSGEANDWMLALFSHFTNATSDGIFQHASNDGCTILIGCNLEGNGTAKNGTNIISIDETTTAPSYANAATNDYTPSAAAVINQEFGSVHDDGAPTAGEGLNGRSSFIDIGAIQIADPAGGGGGMIVHPGTSGGARG